MCFVHHIDEENSKNYCKKFKFELYSKGHVTAIYIYYIYIYYKNHTCSTKAE